jgi:hypothetical protein
MPVTEVTVFAHGPAARLALLRWLDIRESISPIRKVSVFNRGRVESAAGRWFCR